MGEEEEETKFSSQDGLLVQINTTVPGERGLNLSLLFHLHPQYPSCPPDISVSSTAFSRNQCHSIRQRLLERAAALPPEPMVHQLVDWLQQSEEVTEGCRGAEEEVKDRGREERWTAVLSLDHIRSRSRYIGLLERWSQQLQLPGRLLLGQSILVILQGARADIKEFCRLLKTVKVDVDSSGKKCKERMMKVLIETPSYSSCGHGYGSLDSDVAGGTYDAHTVVSQHLQCLCVSVRLQRFVVKEYQSSAELTAVFQELHMTELYQQILPSLSD
uniref:RWD domain-containing protein 3 n=1 Tax=Seriola lalandi dorsalis TaxID=1841481 RepID=A0A3B4XRL4_SERLL